MCNKWFHWKFKYSVKYLQNLNLTPVPIFIFVRTIFFFSSHSLLKRISDEIFQFRKFPRIFPRSSIPFKLLYSGEIVAFSALICKRSRRADYSDPNKSSSSFFFPRFPPRHRLSIAISSSVSFPSRERSDGGASTRSLNRGNYVISRVTTALPILLEQAIVSK